MSRGKTETLPALAVLIGLLDVDFEVCGPPEPVAYRRALTERYRRATPGRRRTTAAGGGRKGAASQGDRP